MTDAITREEKLMKAIATGSPSNIKPITREEMFLAKAGGQDVETPEPITRREKLLQGIIDNGGGGGDVQDVLDGIISNKLGGGISSNVERVGYYALYECRELTSANLPNVKTIMSNAFGYCTKLKNVYMPNVESIGVYGFVMTSELESVDMPKVTKLEGNAFSSSGIKSVNVPLLTTMGSAVFKSCRNLEKVELPLVATDLPSETFNFCSNLKTVILPLVKRLMSSSFKDNTKLDTLVLGSETVCTLFNVNAFQGTPFAIGGTGGTAYVPQALIEEYKIETNWSTLYEAGTVTFVAKEGSEYDV